jgi:hypothetical protein
MYDRTADAASEAPSPSFHIVTIERRRRLQKATIAQPRRQLR